MNNENVEKIKQNI